MIEPLRIAVDTNVLVAGLRSRRGASFRLLQKLKDPRWELNLSLALVLEYEEILKREAGALNLSPQHVDDLVDGLCAITVKHESTPLWRPVARDPEDDFLIELAVQARADYVVTHNKRDLQAAERFGIMVVSPKEFLKEVGEL